MVNAKSYRKLETTKALKSLMQRYFLTLRFFKFGRPVAWVTSGAPVELIRACGFLPAYPENFGALCGARKAGEHLCQIAEGEGFSIDLCSYARANLGAMFQPNLAPGGGLPRPDCIIAATNICNTLIKWFQIAAEYFKVPFYVVEMPFQFSEVGSDSDIDFIYKELQDLRVNLLALSGVRYSDKKFSTILKNSTEAVKYWTLIRESGMHHPSPVNAPDLFIHMAPIVNLRGLKSAVRYYRRLYGEIQERISTNRGAITNEKIRLLWDNIAIWFNLFDFFQFFSERDACFVVSTYTDAWSAEWDGREDPLYAGARIYRDAYLNLSLQKRATMMIEAVKRFDVDGIVMHSDRSCKPYSLGQSEILKTVSEATGVPGILIDADMVDPRFYTDAQVKNRLQAFLEMLENR